MAAGFNAIHSFSDPGLDKKKVFDYDLTIRLRANSMAYCILDSNTNKFLHLEAWEPGLTERKPFVPGDHEPTDTSRIIELLEQDLDWLSQGFNKTHLILDQGKSTLIPGALYKAEEKRTLFEFNVAGGPYPEKEIHHDRLSSIDAFSIYHRPESFNTLISRFFPDASVNHYSTAFIQAVYLKNMNRGNDHTLYVNVADSRFDIMKVKGKTLDYFNSFRYNTAEDFMYYIIFVVEQMGMDPDNIALIMMGEVDKHSSLTDLALKYVRNVRFAARNDDFRYSFVFDQLPAHYYFNLLNASLCE